MTTARRHATFSATSRRRPSAGFDAAVHEFVERIEELSLFQERIAPPKRMPQVWLAFREEIQRLVTPSAAALFMVDPATCAFELRHWSPAGCDADCAREIDAQIECGTFAWIVNRRQPAVIPSLVFRGPLNLVMLPLTTQSRTLGVAMVVTAIEEKTITNERLRLLGLLSKQCALVMENTLLYEELQTEHEALRTAQNRIIQAEKFAALGRLTSGAFHELLNPLNVISGHLQLMMLTGAFEAPWSDYLAAMKKASDRIAAIVNGLLRFSAKRRKNGRPVDIAELLAGVLEDAAARHADHGVSVACAVAPGLRRAAANAEDLKTVLGHLIDNAYDAMPDGGILTIRAHVHPPAADAFNAEPFIEIAVADSGAGIRDGDVHKVFDPFFTTKDVGRGTGLSLALSYALVCSMGGTLTFDSRENDGAVFVVRLPAAPAREG